MTPEGLARIAPQLVKRRKHGLRRQAAVSLGRDGA
jgi:hypothetical protein